LIKGEQAKSVLQMITEQLYTPVGLKSLPAKDPQYVPLYEGDRYKRDGAYHQGTVWSWLLGPYVDAIIKVKGEAGKVEAQKIIDDFKYHLNEACIGSVSEIFDAEAPHHPKGCIAQAWGVAEVLRVIKEYGLYAAKKESLQTAK
jgi:glycogen debranching enzyme